MSAPVRTRRVYLLTGYEPLPPSAHHHRFDREIRRFEKTWSVQAEVGPMVLHDQRPVASWQVTLSGPDWQTRTDVRLLRWDDVIAEDVGRPIWLRLVLYARAALDITLTGTFFRYIAAYWRYSLFAGYPAVLLMAFTALSIGLGLAWACLGGAYPALVAPLLAIGLFTILMRWPGRQFHIDYMLNDWIFARDMIRRTRPSIGRRIAEFAQEITAGVKAGDVDEVVIIAHSLGAAWMVESVAEALAADPDLGRGGTPLGLAGVGSSTLKIALHPAADWIRASVKRVAAATDITWAEYDSHVDFICFYKCNTAQALKIDAPGRPISHSIRLSRMLAPETWGRFRGNLLRVHRQYVMGNEQRYRYDFHMIACGPFRFADIVHDGEGLPEALGPDGACGGAAAFGSSPSTKTAAP